MNQHKQMIMELTLCLLEKELEENSRTFNLTMLVKPLNSDVILSTSIWPEMLLALTLKTM